MEGTNVIVVPEDRKTVEKIKEKTKLQKKYQEKIVDSGASDKVDKFIDGKAKVEQVAIGVIGGVATIALAVCPADGPVGEICGAILTPGLLGLCALKAEVEKKIAHGVKGFYEKKIMKVDKENDNVVVYNDAGEVMDDFMVAMNNVNQIQKASGGMSKGAAA